VLRSAPPENRGKNHQFKKGQLRRKNKKIRTARSDDQLQSTEKGFRQEGWGNSGGGVKRHRCFDPDQSAEVLMPRGCEKEDDDQSRRQAAGPVTSAKNPKKTSAANSTTGSGEKGTLGTKGKGQE